MKRFQYSSYDNQSYKALCEDSKKLFIENRELKQAVRMLKKEKYYWIPLIASCAFVGFALGDGFADKSVRKRDTKDIKLY